MPLPSPPMKRFGVKNLRYCQYFRGQMKVAWRALLIFTKKILSSACLISFLGRRYRPPPLIYYAKLRHFLKLCEWWVGGTTGIASDQQSTNDWKIAGLWPTKVVCITVLTGNRMGWTVRCGRPPLLLPSCRKLEFGTVSVNGLGSGMGKL